MAIDLVAELRRTTFRLYFLLHIYSMSQILQWSIGLATGLWLANDRQPAPTGAL